MMSIGGCDRSDAARKHTVLQCGHRGAGLEIPRVRHRATGLEGQGDV